MKLLLSCAWSALLALTAHSAEPPPPPAPPAPYGAVPNEAQLAWHPLEMYAFCHFSTNTFTGKEWGYGDEDPAIFNPTDFDADQIVGTLQSAGFKGVILTAKHHDGFCLWPTATTPHSIAKSPWREGKGDMVREFAEAAKRHGIGFGVYLSPWDRHQADYGQPTYPDFYRSQLRELLTNYGPLFTVWHDGANGGDGFYGGARETRSIDRTRYYDWPRTWELVRQLQPQAAIFSDVGPDVRWIGNERGEAGYPCWATYSPVGPDGGPPAPGHIQEKFSPTGTPGGQQWLPGECDVSIRPGWFWHAEEDAKVRTPQNLMELYFRSVGRGASLLLNVPPDRRGRLADPDVAALQGFKAMLDRMYSRNLAAGGKARADSRRGKGFEVANMLDDDRESYWSAKDKVRDTVVELKLPERRRFSVIRLREPIRLGQRIRRFAVDVRRDGRWVLWIPNGSSIGSQVLLRGPQVHSDGVRLRILESAACPCLSELSLWLEPTEVPKPAEAPAPPVKPEK